MILQHNEGKKALLSSSKNSSPFTILDHTTPSLFSFYIDVDSCSLVKMAGKSTSPLDLCTEFMNDRGECFPLPRTLVLTVQILKETSSKKKKAKSPSQKRKELKRHGEKIKRWRTLPCLLTLHLNPLAHHH